MNTITAGRTDSGWGTAIHVSQASLAIQSDANGTLNAISNLSTTSDYGSAGIKISGGGLTIKNCTVRASAGADKTCSQAITVGGNVTIDGGTVFANSTGEVTNGPSHGIHVEDNGRTITIAGGTVNASGGNASGASCGIGGDPGTSVVISGGTVTATGGSGSESYGIYAPDNSGQGGTVTIGGGASRVEATGQTQAIYAKTDGV